MRSNLLLGVWTMGILFAGTVCCHAEIIALAETSLDDVLDDGYTVASDMTQTEIGGDLLHTAVSSQAYGNGEHYVYFYQITNSGGSGDLPVTEFVLGTFAGTVTGADVGYLSGTNVPDGFHGSEYDRPPEDYGFVNLVSDGSQVFIYHGWRWDNTIDPGEVGRVLFIRSDFSPGDVNAYLSSGFSTGSGIVVGAVPEPNVAALLITGSLLALTGTWIRSRRRQNKRTCRSVKHKQLLSSRQAKAELPERGEAAEFAVMRMIFAR